MVFTAIMSMSTREIESTLSGLSSRTIQSGHHDYFLYAHITG